MDRRPASWAASGGYGRMRACVSSAVPSVVVCRPHITSRRLPTSPPHLHLHADLFDVDAVHRRPAITYNVVVRRCCRCHTLTVWIDVPRAGAHDGGGDVVVSSLACRRSPSSVLLPRSRLSHHPLPSSPPLARPISCHLQTTVEAPQDVDGPYRTRASGVIFVGPSSTPALPALLRAFKGRLCDDGTFREQVRRQAR